MGISSIPSPSEAVYILLVANTATTMSSLKQFTHSLLHFFGLAAPRDDESDSPEELSSTSFMADVRSLKLFRSEMDPVQFGSAFGRRPAADPHADCRVCLAPFQPESWVDQLPCGHLFHRGCVERWIEYSNSTCPLCRSQLPGTESSSATGGDGISDSPPW
ncbi:putative E3 ubiquitin-protein ligase RHA2B [Apostasia shenzhenica]|uniref:Putative E3 ubiquitin-protein ligase RHA2B n=1 Tax=Apostasia shenzhenica TaxID=1088818 RepID=A0A2I0A8B7_9ASPA|nr:putative E3 ubiquitin-protein ligase RHA2B [Apostasia shenzhenica]